MKRKSITQIHQQTLNIISRLGYRRHTSRELMDAVVRAHNRYIENICSHFDVSAPNRLTDQERRQPVPRYIYFSGPAASSTL